MVSTTTLGTLWLVNQITSKQHSQVIFGGLLGLTKRTIIINSLDTSEVSRLLNVPIIITPIEESGLNWVDKARLNMGQSLVFQSDYQQSINVYTLLKYQDSSYVLQGIFKDFRTSLIQGGFSLIQNDLQNEGQTTEALLENIQKDFAVPMRIVPSSEVESLIPNFNYNQPVPFHYGHYDMSGSVGLFYAYFPAIKKVIEVGPLRFKPELPMQSIFVVVVLAIILTGIAVYWLVFRFEVGLQKLERASTRVASGHLNSRVKVNTDDAIGRLGGAFNRMAEQIQHLMGVQKEMIRAVSHELRTPVARMRFGIQMLEDTTTDAYLQKQLKDMDQDLQELDELVDEILTYARLEEGGPILEFKETNILDLIAQVSDETKRRTDKVDVTIHSQTDLEDHIFSSIEYRYMHRAIQNLVGNACRHASEKVHIEFSCRDDICRIDVEDDGEGIPQKDWDRVFSPFTRLDDSRTRASGGYGLGLSIVQRIIYWHGGKALVGKSRWDGAKMSLLWPKSDQVKPN
jgi:two-component system sensor histidine kinase RstB